MDQIIANLNAKIDFLYTLISLFQEKKVEFSLEPYNESVEITKRALLLTKRMHKFRYVICKFASIAEHIMLTEEQTKTISKEVLFDYDVYLSNICVEFCILLGLSKSGGLYDNPNRVFNDAIKLNNKSQELNVQNTFLNIDGYIPNFKSAAKRLNQFKKNHSNEIQRIKDVRDKYAAHHDLDFNVDYIDIKVIISGFILLTDVWYEMCKAIGVISDIAERIVKKWTIDDYNMEILRIHKLAFGKSENSR